jgi:hypothetical protein
VHGLETGGPFVAHCASRRVPTVTNISRPEGFMPLIKPRTRGKQLVKHRTRLDCENNETLYAYAQFLSESTEYVLNQVIDTVLARDKEFIKWRESHQGSYVPRTKDRLGRKNIGPRRAQAGVVSSGESVTAIDR